MPGEAPKIRSYFGGPGGWTAAKKKVLDSVVLPEKTKCFDCGKFKTTAIAFSEKQQNDLRNSVASGQVLPKDTRKGWITCRTCIGVQKHEMQCVHCEQVKGLEGFAKAQRRTPDEARCITCVAEINNEHPNEKKTAADFEDYESSDDSDSYDTESNIYGSSTNDTDDLESDHGVRLPGHEMSENQKPKFSRGPTARSSASTTSTTTSTATTGASKGSVADWQEVSRKNAGHRFTAYDAQGKAHAKSYSSAATNASDDSDSTTTTTQATLVVREKPGSKFAKVKVNPRKFEVPQHNAGRTVDYDSGSDDDDDAVDEYFTI